MIEYGRPYNIHEDGLYVKIYNKSIEIQSKMYNNTLEMEIYYENIEIDKTDMNVYLLDSYDKTISVIYHAKRIWDMR